MDVTVELKRKIRLVTCIQGFWERKKKTVCYAWNCCAKYKECHTITYLVQQIVYSGKYVLTVP